MAWGKYTLIFEPTILDVVKVGIFYYECCSKYKFLNIIPLLVIVALDDSIPLLCHFIYLLCIVMQNIIIKQGRFYMQG